MWYFCEGLVEPWWFNLYGGPVGTQVQHKNKVIPVALSLMVLGTILGATCSLLALTILGILAVSAYIITVVSVLIAQYDKEIVSYVIVWGAVALAVFLIAMGAYWALSNQAEWA